jgi:PleD family two-component response regulator
VKHFVEIHKGKITYTSELNEGTQFFVSLKKGMEHFGDQPIFEEVPEATILSEELMQPGALPAKKAARDHKGVIANLVNENKSLLLVDDDDHMRSYLEEIFSTNYTVYQAENGEEGLHLAYQYRPDIIISDVKMPGISGIDFCR